jgi:hypothetical protein
MKRVVILDQGDLNVALAAKKGFAFIFEKTKIIQFFLDSYTAQE